MVTLSEIYSGLCEYYDIFIDNSGEVYEAKNTFIFSRRKVYGEQIYSFRIAFVHKLLSAQTTIKYVKENLSAHFVREIWKWDMTLYYGLFNMYTNQQDAQKSCD